MRGTSSREDLADWVIQIKDNDDDFETEKIQNVKQIKSNVRFTKNRTGTNVETEDFLFHCKTIENKMTISFSTVNMENVIINYIESGIDKNKDLADAIGKSKYAISRLTTKLLNTGKIIKTQNGSFVSKREAYKN
jgi:hypothetical protein